MQSDRSPRDPVLTLRSVDQSKTPDSGVGERIAEARQARGLNRNRLARQLGTSWAVVNRWEKGRAQPSSESMRRLSEVLGVTIDWLFGYEAPAVSQVDERLANFLSSLAPADITEVEIQWLRAAPGSSLLTATDYRDILNALRGPWRIDETGEYPKAGHE